MSLKNKLLLLVLGGLVFAEEVVYSPQAYNDSVTVVKVMFKSFMIIFFLLGLLFIWYKYILPKVRLSGNVESNMKVVDKLMLDSATVLYLVQVGDRYQVVSNSNKNVSVIETFKKDEIALKFPEYQAGQENNSFKDLLGRFMKKKDEGKIEDPEK